MVNHHSLWNLDLIRWESITRELQQGREGGREGENRRNVSLQERLSTLKLPWVRHQGRPPSMSKWLCGQPRKLSLALSTVRWLLWMIKYQVSRMQIRTVWFRRDLRNSQQDCQDIAQALGEDGPATGLQSYSAPCAGERCKPPQCKTLFLCDTEKL